MKHVLNSTTCVMLHRSQYRVESCVSTVKAVTTFRSLTEVSPICDQLTANPAPALTAIDRSSNRPYMGDLRHRGCYSGPAN